MKRKPRANQPPLEPGASNPLDAAVSGRDQDTISMVREAVRHKQAMLAFQPIKQANDTSKTAFFEGFVRILDATGRVIPARDFMPVVENTELGREIDALALGFGCRTLANHPHLRLSVNMSARSIGYQPWMDTLNRWLRKDASIGYRLILEMNEDSVMGVPDLVTDFMDRLQPLGICFALDDFAAGITALRFFRDFYFDVMKIDGQFLRGLSSHPENLGLIRCATAIAREFEMLCVAEMVDSDADAALLAQIGVDCVQGYHFGMPLTNPDWLQGGHGKRAATA